MCPIVPMCAKLATLYLLAPVQNAVVENVFSHQNLILTSKRFSMFISTVNNKVFLKYCTFFFSDEQVDKIIERAAEAWFKRRARVVLYNKLNVLAWSFFIMRHTKLR